MLTARVEPGFCAEAEAVEVIVHGVDADIAAYLVKVDVAGLLDCVMQIDRAMTLRFPVTVAVLIPRQLVVAATQVLAGQVGCTCLDRRQCEHWLDRRARRVGATRSAIE